jgi:hypothetical protein
VRLQSTPRPKNLNNPWNHSRKTCRGDLSAYLPVFQQPASLGPPLSTKLIDPSTDRRTPPYFTP